MNTTPAGPRTESRTRWVGRFCYGIGPIPEGSGTIPQIWHRTDSVGNLLPGLGPPRSAQREWGCVVTFAQTVGPRLFPPRPLTQRGGLAVSRLDGRGISRRIASCPEGFKATRGMDLPFPDPFLGSRPVFHRCRRRLVRWVRRAASRGSLTLRCGTPLAATLTRIACWAFWRPEFRVALSLAAGPTVPAIACFARI